MMKFEFDEMIGFETDPKCYERIEAVYMSELDFFRNKKEVAKFYKKYDMGGIERLYKIDAAYQGAIQKIDGTGDSFLETFLLSKYKEMANEILYLFYRFDR